MPLLALERFCGEGASMMGGCLSERSVRLASSNAQEASTCKGVTRLGAQPAAAESESNVCAAPNTSILAVGSLFVRDHLQHGCFGSCTLPLVCRLQAVVAAHFMPIK